MRIGRFLSVTDVQNYIIQHHQPALLIARNTQSIPNATLTDVIFDTEIYDELDMWAVGDPTNIHTPEDAIWTIVVFLAWAANNTGYRYVQLGGSGLPSVTNEVYAGNLLTDEHGFTHMRHIDATDPTRVIVYQTSGGALTLQTAQLMMLRHVKIAYPL